MRRAIPFAIAALLVLSALGDHYFRDEFYYLACARHLDWGYVDHPPLSIAILWIVRHLFGDSLLTLRSVAALAAAASVWTTGAIARRLGAGSFGQAIAMLAFGLAPQVLAAGSFYSMNVLDILAWTLAVRVFVDLLDAPSLSRWLLLGVILGLGLENKISVLWLGAGLAAGLGLTGARRLLLTPGPWVTAIVAGLLFAPHVLWQLTNGWPTLEFVRNASAVKMQTNTPTGFIVDQIVNMNVVLLPVWLGGLLFLLFSSRVARYRPLGIAFLTVVAILILNRTSRGAYLSAAYPVLFAAGGALAERVLRGRVMRTVALAVIVAAGAVTAPFALPLLSIDRYVQYSRALGVAPSTEERVAVGRLPQFFADRQGWDRIVDQVAKALDLLTPAERAAVAVWAGNYGEAGAVELLGPARGLVGLVVLSGHNNYWLWGPQGRTGDVLIVISGSRAEVEQVFASVQEVGPIQCGDCMPYENKQAVYVARQPRVPLALLWPRLKHYS